MGKRILVFLLALAFALPQAWAVSANAATVPATGAQLLIHFKASASGNARAAGIAKIGGIRSAEIADLGVTRVALGGGANRDAALATVAADPTVDWVEPDAPITTSLAPNDTYWSTDPITGLGQWGLRKIQAPLAW